MFCSKKVVLSIALGQLISILIAGTGIFTTELVIRGISFPTTQNAPNYLLLCFFIIPLLKNKGGYENSFWKYAILGLIDVEANYLITLAYQFSPITSVMLLDCFTIPSVMIISKVFLKANYGKWHTVGAFLSLAGLGLTVVSDVLASQEENAEYPQAVKGDLLCLCGAALYAIDNVIEEVICKKSCREEWLSGVGFWGLLICGVQIACVEREAFDPSIWSPAAGGCLVGYIACLFSMYNLTSVLLKISDSAMFNISLLTSDVYAVLFFVLSTTQAVGWLYSISFFLTMTGVLVYNRQGSATEHIKKESGHIDQESALSTTEPNGGECNTPAEPTKFAAVTV